MRQHIWVSSVGGPTLSAHALTPLAATAVAFMTFGSFWLSYCVLLIPFFQRWGSFYCRRSDVDKLQPGNRHLPLGLVVVFIIILASFKSSGAIVVTLALIEVSTARDTD